MWELRKALEIERSEMRKGLRDVFSAKMPWVKIVGGQDKNSDERGR
jgi:hypothetical protein